MENDLKKEPQNNIEIIIDSSRKKVEREHESKIIRWIENILNEKLQSDNLCEILKSGVILCRIINKIEPGSIPHYATSSKLHPLIERENINFYLEACWKLGMDSRDIFLTSDLSNNYLKAVMNNLTALSHIAAKFHTVNVDPIGNSRFSKMIYPPAPSQGQTSKLDKKAFRKSDNSASPRRNQDKPQQEEIKSPRSVTISKQTTVIPEVNKLSTSSQPSSDTIVVDRQKYLEVLEQLERARIDLRKLKKANFNIRRLSITVPHLQLPFSSSDSFELSSETESHSYSPKPAVVNDKEREPPRRGSISGLCSSDDSETFSSGSAVSHIRFSSEDELFSLSASASGTSEKKKRIVNSSPKSISLYSHSGSVEKRKHKKKSLSKQRNGDLSARKYPMKRLEDTSADDDGVLPLSSDSGNSFKIDEKKESQGEMVYNAAAAAVEVEAAEAEAAGTSFTDEMNKTTPPNINDELNGPSGSEARLELIINKLEKEQKTVEVPTIPENKHILIQPKLKPKEEEEEENEIGLEEAIALLQNSHFSRERKWSFEFQKVNDEQEEIQWEVSDSNNHVRNIHNLDLKDFIDNLHENDKQSVDKQSNYLDLSNIDTILNYNPINFDTSSIINMLKENKELRKEVKKQVYSQKFEKKVEKLFRNNKILNEMKDEQISELLKEKHSLQYEIKRIIGLLESNKILLLLKDSQLEELNEDNKNKLDTIKKLEHALSTARISGERNHNNLEEKIIELQSEIQKKDLQISNLMKENRKSIILAEQQIYNAVNAPSSKLKETPKQVSLGILHSSDNISNISDMDFIFLMNIRPKVKDTIFGDQEPTETEIRNFGKLLAMPIGGRFFFQLLQQAIIDSKCNRKEITVGAFDLLVSLIDTTLDSLNIRTGGDYICAKIIMEISTTICVKRPGSSGKEFIKDHICKHSAWSNLSFWEEYFWDSTAQKIPWKENISSHSELSKNQRESILKIIRLFIVKMTEWVDFPAVNIRKFVQDIIPKLGLAGDEDLIIEKVLSLLERRKEPASQRKRSRPRTRSDINDSTSQVPMKRSTSLGTIPGTAKELIGSCTAKGKSPYRHRTINTDSRVTATPLGIILEKDITNQQELQEGQERLGSINLSLSLSESFKDSKGVLVSPSSKKLRAKQMTEKGNNSPPSRSRDSPKTVKSLPVIPTIISDHKSKKEKDREKDNGNNTNREKDGRDREKTPRRRKKD